MNTKFSYRKRDYNTKGKLIKAKYLTEFYFPNYNIYFLCSRENNDPRIFQGTQSYHSLGYPDFQHYSSLFFQDSLPPNQSPKDKPKSYSVKEKEKRKS